MKNNFKFSSASLVLGVVALLGIGNSGLGLMALVPGIAMVLGALAYRSRKRIKLGLIEDGDREIWEILAICGIVAATLGIPRAMGAELLQVWYVDPVPSLIIPAWAILAYFWIANKKSVTASPLQPEQSQQPE